MKKMKLFVIMACILALLLTAAAPGFASGIDELEGFAYTLDEENGTILLTEYTGSQPNVTVEGSYTVDGREYATRIDNVHLFRYNTTITSVTIKDGVKPAGTTLSGLFYQCENLVTADVKGLDTTGVRSFNHLFSYCKKLKTIDVTGWNTSSLLNLSLAFNYCSALTTINGYEDWDTSSVWTIKFLFNNTSSIQKIDLSRWDLSQVTNSGWCFQMCNAKEIILPDSLSLMSAGFLNHPSRYSASSLTIPSGVKKIGYAHTIYDFGTNAFNEIKVAEGNEYYKAVDGILYSMDGSELLAVPRGKTFENNVYEIPNDVTFMGELSFSRNYNIHTIILPDNYIIEYVPLNDPRYTIEDGHGGNDTGNLNSGTNLSIAIYCYTGITDYEVRDTNPNYASVNGLVYSKDMKTLVAVPSRYAKQMNIPEGVTEWRSEAMWADESSTVDNLMANSSGVYIPASLVNIAEDQLLKLNRLAGRTSSPFTIEIAGDNPRYYLEDGKIVDSYADYSELKSALNAAEEIDPSLYTEASLAALEAAVQAGRQLPDNLTSDNQSVVDAAARAIRDAIDALVEKSSVTAVDYTPSSEETNAYNITVSGRPFKLRFIGPDGGTMTFDRYSDKVSITSYTADGTECSSLAREQSYEVWTINAKLADGTPVNVAAKHGSEWENGFYSFTAVKAEKENDYALYSAELASAEGADNRVTATVKTGLDVSKIRFTMKDGGSVTLNAADYATEVEGQLVFTYDVYTGFAGENDITLEVKTGSTWVDGATLTYNHVAAE